MVELSLCQGEPEWPGGSRHPAGRSATLIAESDYRTPLVCAAMHPCANALPVINIEAVARGDLSANPIARREFLGPGRKGWDGLFSPLSPTFLLHYFRPQESILHHVNVM